MAEVKVELIPLQEDEKENFIADIQAAFKKAYVEEFGDDGEEVLPRSEVEKSFNAEGAESYKIIHNGENVGGAILKISRKTNVNKLALFYIKLGCHSKGLGLAAWHAIENLHPETKIWETFTPYFEKRNLHFYVNKCGFKIVEFYNPNHPLPEEFSSDIRNDSTGTDFCFRFEKEMTA